MNFGLLCCASAPYFDFMSVCAAVPRPVLTMGFDSSAGPVKIPVGPDGAGFQQWDYSRFVDVLGSSYGFWREITIVDTYEGGFTTTSHQKAFPYYFNPADTEDHLVNGTANDPNPAHDLRLSGLPSSNEAIGYPTVITGDETAGGTRRIASSTEYYLMRLADDDHPPTFISESEVIIHYLAEWTDQPAAPYPLRILNRHISLAGKMTDADIEAAATALATGIPLTPGSGIGTREGTLAFDYFGLSANNPTANYVPADAVYDSGGFYTVTIPANTLLGITCGANDCPLSDLATLFPDATSGNFKTGHYFPFHWPDGGSYDYTMTTGIKPTIFMGGMNGYNGVAAPAGVKDSTVFCSAGTSVRLGGGVAGQQVTAIITGTHVNQVFVFPLRSGSIITAQFDALPPVAMRIHQVDSPNYGGTGFFYGFLASASRLRIPVGAMAKTDDVTYFKCITWAGYGNLFPSDALSINTVNLADYTDVTEQFLTRLPAGEYLYYPSDVSSATGWGFIHFTNADSWTTNPTGAGDPGTGAGDSGAGSTSTSGSL